MSPPVSSSRVVNIEDLRGLAQSRVPKAVFEYLDSGAEAEITLVENCRAFRDVLLRPRSAVAFGESTLKTRVLGHELSFPAMLAPVGYSRLMHPGSEVAAARAAGEAGTGYILSTISGYKLEDVKAACKGPVWYQLYLLGGREAAEGALERARSAGFSALVMTVDTPVAGFRERDPRNGMNELLGASLFAKIPFLPNILAHASWLPHSCLMAACPAGERRHSRQRPHGAHRCCRCPVQSGGDLGRCAYAISGPGRLWSKASLPVTTCGVPWTKAPRQWSFQITAVGSLIRCPRRCARFPKWSRPSMAEWKC
jgi:hypothetical protein